MKKIIFVLLIMFASLPYLNAECTYEEEKKLSELASHVNYTYEYKRGKDYFDITIYNVIPELKILYNTNIISTNGSKVTIKDYRSENNYKIQIYSSGSSSCPNKYIREIFVEVPIYNSFYTSDECENYKDFKYCSKFLLREISNDEFSKEYNEYLANIDYKEYIENEKNKKNSENENVEINYLNVILITFCFLFLIFIVIIIYKILRLKRLQNER